MRAARVFRWIMRIFILLLTLSLSVVSILGAMSAVNIFSESNNVQIPYGSIDTSTFPTNIDIPFRVSNVGYFDLNNLEIGFELEMTYNGTHTQIIYNDSQNFGNIAHGTILTQNYTLSGFDLPPDFTGPSFEANITITGSYSLDLISFEIHLTDIAIA